MAIDGTSGNDVLNGTAGDDVINGLAGNDTLNGLDGNDTLTGGSGVDTLNGGNGDDTIVITGSDSSHDIVNGGAGFDVIVGGAGNDTIRLYSYTGANTVERIDGGAGVNVIATAVGSATVLDLSGTELINIAQILGGTGSDTITGSAAADVIVGGAGNDVMSGGAGDDTFLITGTSTHYDTIGGGSGFDTIAGGAGDDTFRLWNYTGANTVERIDGGAGMNVIAAVAGSNTVLDLSGTELVNIAQILGGSGNDTITGSAGADVIVGGAGNDVMNGGAGDDTFLIIGTGTHYDTINGGSGFDVIAGNGGDDTFRLWNYTGANTVERIDGGAGVNVIAAAAGSGTVLNLSGTELVNITQILGGSGGDTITGGAGDDVISGAGGNDTLAGGGGADTLDGGTGFDSMLGGAGDDSYSVDSASDSVTENAGEGTDTVNASISYTLGTNVENLTLTGATAINGTGNTLNNVITGNAAANTLTGAAGNDTLIGGGGNDLYLFNTGFGQDVVVDQDATAGNTDIIRFGAGITPASVTATRAGSDLVLTRGADSVTVQNWFVSDADKVERVEFADATVWDVATINAMTGGGNQPPVNTVPGTQSGTEDTAKVIAGISVSDADAGANPLTMTLTVTNGTVSVNAGVAGGAAVSGNGTAAITLTGPQSAINATLADAMGVTYNPTSNFNGAATLTVVSNDGAASDSDPITINVAAVNDAPAATNLTQAKAYLEDAAGVALDDIVVTEVDSGDTITATLTLVLPGAGSLTTSGTATYTAGTGVWTVSGSAAQVNAALAAVTFVPTANSAADTTITTQIRDAADSGPANGTITLDVAPVNDAPTATNLTQTRAYTEGAASVALDDIVVTEVDAGDTITATLTLALAAAGALTTSGTATYTAGTGVWTISGTVAQVNAALAAVAFVPATNNAADTTITTQIRDAAVTGPANGTITLDVTPVNDAPTATNLTQTKAYTEGAASVALNDIVVTDVDTGNTITATLTLALPAAGALTTSGTATYTAGTGVWTISGTVAQVNAALAAVAFVPATNNAADTTITTQIRDAAATGPANGTITLDVTPVNDAPALTGLGGTATYALGGGAVTVDASITVSDVDSASLASATVSITGGFSAGDRLIFNDQGGITGSYNTGTGVLALTGSASLAAYDTALESITFSTTSTTTGNRTLSFIAGDGAASSAAATATVTVGAGNNSISLSGFNGTNGGFKLVGEAQSGAFTGVRAGYSVASAGDVNGDGFGDMVIGAFKADPNRPGANFLFDSGQVLVVYGGANLSGAGATLPGANTTNGFNLGGLSGTRGFKLNGVAFGTGFGNAVGAADINGDGYSDPAGMAQTIDGVSNNFLGIVAGDSTADINTNLPGTATTTGFNITSATGALGSVRTTTGIGGVTLNTSVVGVQDYSADGKDALLVGDPAAPGSSFNGAAYLVAPTSMSNLNTLQLNTTNSGGQVLKFIGGGTAFVGSSVASVDINADGIQDLLIGAGQANGGDGAVYVVYGGATLQNLIANNATTHILDTGFNLTTLNGTNGLRVNGSPGSAAGISMSRAGDFNGDGIGDFIVGAPVSGNGDVFIVYGNTHYGHGTNPATLNLATLTAAQGLRITTDLAGAFYGWSVGGGGDVNGDGYGDVVIGNNGFSVGHLIFGNSTANLTSQFNGSLTIATDNSNLNGQNGVALVASAAGGAPTAVAIGGDINADGFAEVLVGASTTLVGGLGSTGITFVVYGGNLSSHSTAGLGSVGAPVLASGNTTSVMGGLGNDFLSSGAFSDVTLHGGAGNDTIFINASERLADGGGGNDTLKLINSGQALDFAGLDNFKTSFENIDLRGTGANTLTLAADDVLDLSDTTHTLFVRGEADDRVISSGQGWTAGADQTIGGVTYNTYSIANSTARLLVEDTITQLIIS